eukprot:XP_011669527.1 PREDICTED: serine/threonine-protein phosphatase 6 regulatory ankyrin repeat subunit B-like [Strongylocentrotus purpuratus]
MGVNTDGEETGPGSTVTDEVEHTEKDCDFEQHRDNEKSPPQDADCDVGIQEQKPAKGTGIPLITSLPNMPSQPTSGALNTEHNEAQREHTDGEDRGLSNTPTLLRPNVDIEDVKIELSHGALVNLNTDTSADDKFVKLEECTSPLQPGDVVDILETDTNDALYAMYTTLKEESLSDVIRFLMSKGTDLNEENFIGRIPLHSAAIDGNTEVIEYLIQQGSDVNKEDTTGWTPFHAAIQYGHLDVIKYLVTEGAKQTSFCGIPPLHVASLFGHLDVVKYFISKGADVNEGDAKCKIPLHGAASRGHMKVMECLIQHGSDVDKADAKGLTPFNAAVRNGQLEAVKYLLTGGAKQTRYNGMTPLFIATQFGHLDIVQFLIDKGADVNEEDAKGMIPLHDAASRGHIEVIEYLIKHGSDVNKGDAKGWTPFNAALQNGHLEAVKYLMNQGAKQNRYDGMTPLYAAAQIGHLDIVKFFISNGADVNEEHDNGMIPLHGAAAESHLEIMEYLIQQGSNVNKGDAKGRTPIIAAAQYDHLEAVKYLMTEGAKQNRYDGMNPLYAAAEFGQLDVVQFFIANGADVNEGNNDGMIPLHSAAIRGHVKVMEYLIQQGSNVNKKDNTGWTPFNAAVQNGHLEAVNYLMTEGARQNRYIGMTPLFAAARLGHLDIVKFLRSNGADVNKENTKHLGLIPLHGAAINGNIDVLEYLIQQGSIVNKGDVNNWTPFDAAIEFGHLEAVKYLMTKGAKPNRNDGITPFHNAAKFGHLDIVKFFVGKGADVNKEDNTGMIPLHDAASGGHLEVMEYLIQQGSDVNKADEKSWTPIIAAVQNGHLKAVEYLTTEGARPNRIGGMPPLYAAAHFGHLDIIKFLVSKEADVNKEDDDGMTPLHGAAARGHVEVVEYLIQQGSDVNKKDNTGGTAFNAAVKEGHLRAVKYLMAKGAKATRLHGKSPLHIATQYDHVDIVHFLVSNGYDVNKRNECGKSPLHAACYNGNMDIVKVLIHHNANVNEQDHDGWSPLNAAAQEGHQDIVDYLALNGADMHVRDIDGLTPLHAAVNAGHPHSIEGISSCRGDPDEEVNGFPRSGGHQNLITRGYVTITMKDDKNSRKRQLAYQVDNEDGNDCTQADNAKRGADELSLKSLPTRTNDDEKGGYEEHNPFIHAKLKYPDKVEQEPMLDQMEAIKSPVTKKRDTTTNGTDFSSPRGSQTWQHISFYPFYLEIMGTDGHPSEKPESRCHSLIDENMRESSSPMNAGDDLPIKATSVKFESYPTHQPAVVHQKLYDGNPVSTHGTSSNPVWKIGTKHRTAVYRCPSILALVQTFLQMSIAMAIILAGSPVLVAGSGITERVTLQAGKPGMVPFHLPLPPNSTSQTVPYYTLRFESRHRPFCINGEADIEGFKNSSQLQRFTTSITGLDTSPCVNLMIDNVDSLDEDGYLLTAVWHSLENVWHETMKKEIDVQFPPGPAKCFITLSEDGDYPYEVHCRATTGSVQTTLSCYQNDQKIDVKGDITDNGGCHYQSMHCGQGSYAEVKSTSRRNSAASPGEIHSGQ